MNASPLRIPIRVRAALAAGSALLLAGCANAAQPAAVRGGDEASGRGRYPVTVDVMDDAGKKLKQTVGAEPKRVVVIGQALAELMVEFGLDDRIVGVGYLDNSYSKYADRIAKLPKISDQLPSREAVLALRPDLVLTMSFALKPDKIGEIPFWNERGVDVLPAVNYTAGRDLDSYYEDVRHVGEVFGRTERTEAYTRDQKSRIAAIGRRAKKATDSPEVLLVASGGRDTYDYYAPSLGLVDEMVNGAGGTYLELTDDSYAQLSLESIVAADPDKIIVTEFQKSDGAKSRDRLLRDPRLKNVTAIRNGAVMIADYTTSIRGSLALADLCEDVAEFVHPDLFPAS
ncbi:MULTISPECIES: ABC transporter substrate-binding protein [unclassified Streptomyces]|uniref:ABC transporter substrate-binding protein n=1 Tax=unclassified Streptomyces TaxID=2593676 RepID=UPI0022501198|nr:MULTISPECIES: ABC transporter substrate-binding protein [unclassified Streptomyces]MCX4864468.1 ABC transporter substrate-binding protein [Streptomyces sp. NBC_00906]MCX4895706.1 ABC transporter substrate-binding protein [Streptomyces sp. NBC_00892]